MELLLDLNGNEMVVNIRTSSDITIDEFCSVTTELKNERSEEALTVGRKMDEVVNELSTFDKEVDINKLSCKENVKCPLEFKGGDVTLKSVVIALVGEMCLENILSVLVINGDAISWDLELSITSTNVELSRGSVACA